jgi:type VI secretion system protein ImpK
VQGSFDGNPLVAAARPLFALVPRLRLIPVYEAVEGLHEELTREIQRFENQALQRGVAQKQARYASYALCSLLDETVLNTPWGANSFWPHRTLLVGFHGEAFGGEKFFQLLKQLMQQPTRENLELIEVLWLCLALGFEGRYRQMRDGPEQLDRIRAEVYQLIRRLGKEPEPELSPRWRGVVDSRSPLVRHVPLWVVGGAAAAFLLLIYLGFLLAISGRSDAVAGAVSAASREEVPMISHAYGDLRGLQPVVAPAAKAKRFNRVLKSEIDRGLVKVVDDRILRIRDSFLPGSDRIKPEFQEMLAKIAKELEAGHDSVLITGHTDDKPIHTLRFPSNFELSEARAKQVMGFLQASANLAGTVKAQGLADGDPAEPNDSPDHRAVNRRVDILVQ